MVHMALEFWMEPQVQLTSTSTAVWSLKARARVRELILYT